ncbi:MAG: peptidase M22 [Oscillospiraceae bacterium]
MSKHMVLGIDTSNYTTSCAMLDTNSMMLVQKKQLLPVAEGAKGIRQSDAVFHHVRQLPALLDALFAEAGDAPCAVGVSVKPTAAEGSYMPCFLAGECAAAAAAGAAGIPLETTTHQTGHILAALLSCGKLDLIRRTGGFYAFHVSGGTTDAVLCEPDAETVLRITPLAKSLDLKAGQAVDRVGLTLGLRFPCGAALEQLAAQSDTVFKIKPVLRGGDCSLSGLENRCARMLADGVPNADVAKYCLDFLTETISAMTAFLIGTHGAKPVVFAGGVMSDRLIQNKLAERFSAQFAEPALSCDNAAGVAVYAALKRGLLKWLQR